MHSLGRVICVKCNYLNLRIKIDSKKFWSLSDAINQTEFNILKNCLLILRYKFVLENRGGAWFRKKQVKPGEIQRPRIGRQGMPGKFFQSKAEH